MKKILTPYKTLFYTLLLGGVLIFTSLLSISIGSTNIPIEAVAKILFAKTWGGIELHGIDEAQQVIIWVIRTPRVMVAALVGIALAIAGVQMQGLLQNPLASPDLVGTSSGGALGAVIALATGLAAQSFVYLPLLSFLGAFLALFMVYLIATQRGHTPVVTLLLAGVALNTFIGAVTSFLISAVWTDHEIAREIVFWMMGGLDSRTWAHVGIILPSVCLGILIGGFYSRELDILLMGQDTAYSLGVEVERVKQIILVNTALLTSAAVAVSGIVGFVGLIIPHAVRLLIGPKHRDLIPISAFSGAIFLVLIDLLARTLHRPQEIRLGILTAALGAPFFLYLLLRHRQTSW